MAICSHCRGVVRWSNVETEEDDGREMHSCPHCGKVLGFG
ncbi:MAG: hypothetical protein MAG715_01022 [Methanonatronarchaeales archaeon]|nr:hypothetical protein [Methanonatronarchaeales archaeon]